MRKILLYTLLLLSYCFTINAQNTYNEQDKEGLRKILRQEGVYYYDFEQNVNFKLYGLSESDTLSWYNNEVWVDKLMDKNIKTPSNYLYYINISWNDDVPKKITALDWNKGTKDTKFTLADFSELESINVGLRKDPQMLYAQTSIVDISNCSKLESIGGFGVKIINPAGSELPQVETISLSDAYSGFDFTKTPSLKALGLMTIFTGNGVRNINLSNCPDIESIYILSTGIYSINLTGASKLSQFSYSTGNFGDTSIEHIDFSDCVSLKDIKIGGYLEGLKSLDLSNNINLETISLMHINGLQEDIVWGDISPKNLHMEECVMPSKTIDLSKMNRLEKLVCKKNELRQIRLPENGVLDTVNIEQNSLLPSQLPLAHYSVFEYKSQSLSDTIYVPCDIDLRNELIVDGQETAFKWEYFDFETFESGAFFPANSNGVFQIEGQFADKGIKCYMKNDRFPDLTVTAYLVSYMSERPVGVDVTEASEDVQIQQSIVSAGSPFTITSTAAGKAYLYNLNGVLLFESNIKEGQNELYTNSNGLYLLKVSLNDGASKIFKVIRK